VTRNIRRRAEGGGGERRKISSFNGSRLRVLHCIVTANGVYIYAVVLTGRQVVTSVSLSLDA
jgi:hypothetical protein